MNDLVLAACVFVAILAIFLLVKGGALATAIAKKIVKLGGASYPVELEQVVIRIQVEEEDWLKRSKLLAKAQLQRGGSLGPPGGIFGSSCLIEERVPTVTSMIVEVGKNADSIELWPHGVEVMNDGTVVGYSLEAMESYRKVGEKP